MVSVRINTSRQSQCSERMETEMNLTPSQLFRYGIGLYVLSWVAWTVGLGWAAEYADIGARIALVAGVVFMIFPAATGDPQSSGNQQNPG